ncbi:hypothetical protein HZH66_014375 [Vespula vulgaris]|uniref:Uncharacterized protein n=1 Tax=Vespula vulgaris TaxID=7454 RepID=A0A834J1N4_VESVU|nr:hypothetical protein HZH66_014375 [Vespula vulgaris]
MQQRKSKFLTERYEDEGELRIVWLSVNIYREYSVSLSCQRIEEEDERDFCRATGQGRECLEQNGVVVSIQQPSLAFIKFLACCSAT